MARHIIWRRILDDNSFELAQITADQAGHHIAGTVLIAEEHAPLRVDYRIDCDGSWNAQHVTLTQSRAGQHLALELKHDLHGRWSRDGIEIPSLHGCSDFDLSVSPSTNTLPINRLGLEIGAAATIRAAWIRFPSLEVAAVEQSYERLTQNRYRYRGVESGFEAILDTDSGGLVTEYGDIWRRIAEGPA